MCKLLSVFRTGELPLRPGHRPSLHLDTNLSALTASWCRCLRVSARVPSPVPRLGRLCYLESQKRDRTLRRRHYRLGSPRRTWCTRSTPQLSAEPHPPVLWKSSAQVTTRALRVDLCTAALAVRSPVARTWSVSARLPLQALPKSSSVSLSLRFPSWPRRNPGFFLTCERNPFWRRADRR
jgi:hypothetical protein